MLPIGRDWLTILPAVQAFLQGQDPYAFNEGFHVVIFPFWTFIALAPFALLPFWIGRTLLFIVSLSVFFVTAVKMGASRWQVILFLLSSAVVGCLNNGNIDWLVMAGLWMPPQIGLFFVLMKPQVGLGIALYWLADAHLQGGIKKVVMTALPVTLAYTLSFLLYGPWITSMIGMNDNPYNMSGFPVTLLTGYLLLFQGVRQQDRDSAIVSGPLIAPYVSQFSYAAVLLALFRRRGLFLFAWVLLWIPVLVRILFT